MRREQTDLFAANPGFSLKESLQKYAAHYPLFILSLLLCVGAGILYTRYTPPKYLATTSIYAQGIIATANETSPSGDLIESALNGRQRLDLENEMRLLQSSSLMERVVAKNGFNISYYIVGRLLKSNVYSGAPFRLYPTNIKDSAVAFSLTLKNLSETGGILFYGNENTEKQIRFIWNMPINVDANVFILSSTAANPTGDGVYVVQWRPVAQAAEKLLSKLTVNALDTKTSIIQLNILTENLQEGKDILNATAQEFNLADMEDRNKLSENTVRFINERLNIISDELKGVEGNLENYQGSNQLIDIKSQSSQSFENTNLAANTIKELSIQQGIANMIVAYFSDPGKGKLVPSSLGLNDPTLTSLITQYNDLQLKKEREAPMVAVNSTVMQDFNTQLDNLRASILESLANIKKNIALQQSSLQQHDVQNKQFLAALPHNERLMQEIKRKQSITEGLYLYLLQKREEAAISSTSANLPQFRQIDPAKGYGPVEPNTRNIRLYTVLLGLFIPFAWIYLRDILNDKILNREDIVKKIPVPFIGEISHVHKQKNKIVLNRSRDLLGEQFRIIRTNLAFLNRKFKVVLVTSSVGAEGKSFVSINLASVLAMPGKKVALLEFDMRRPGISDALNLNGNTGITQYLSGETTDLFEIYQVSDQVPMLHIYSCGNLPFNPADILLNENITALFSELRQHYDYIVVDSAPAGLVSDAFILGELSDVVIYVIRQRVSVKRRLDFLNEIYTNGKLKNIGIVLNDVKTGGKYGYGYEYEGKNGYYDQSARGRKIFPRKRANRTVKAK